MSTKLVDVTKALPPSPMPHRITEILRKEEGDSRGGTEWRWKCEFGQRVQVNFRTHQSQSLPGSHLLMARNRSRSWCSQIPCWLACLAEKKPEMAPLATSTHYEVTYLHLLIVHIALLFLRSFFENDIWDIGPEVIFPPSLCA